MGLRVAIVGPGRVGRCFARQFAAAGFDVAGFVGRPGSTSPAAAMAFAGTGRELGPPDLAAVHVVVFATGDADLGGAVAAQLAGGAARPCALWLHTSGRHGLEVLAPASAAGMRIGAVHPVAPFPTAERGLLAMAGAPGVWLAGPRAARLLGVLLRALGLVPVAGCDGNRVLYHAACALAANGLTALRSLVDQALLTAACTDAEGARRVAAALLANALHTCEADGPVAALSGPVRRGDAATVAAHLGALAAHAPAVLPAYRALQQAALPLAQAAGLPPAAAAAVAAVLARAEGG